MPIELLDASNRPIQIRQTKHTDSRTHSDQPQQEDNGATLADSQDGALFDTALPLTLPLLMEAYRLNRKQPLGRQVLAGLMNNPQKMKAMAIAGRRGVMEQYSWPIVIKQWRLLLEELKQQRLHAHNQEQTSSREPPFWLPPMVQGYAVYPGTNLSINELETSSDDLCVTEANNRAQVVQDHWDGDLKVQLSISLERGVTPNTRLQGWLLKQEFFTKHTGA